MKFIIYIYHIGLSLIPDKNFLKTPLNLGSSLKYLVISILLEGWRGTKDLSIYLLPALLSSLPLILFTTEEITGCTKEAAKVANKAERNPPSCFLFLVLLFQ